MASISETTTAQHNQSTTAASITETTTAQHNQSTIVQSPGDGGSVAAVIVVLVLAIATGCIITCTVVVWKRITARKNSIGVRYWASLYLVINVAMLSVCDGLYTEHQIFANFAMVDHFATIESAKPKLY